MPLLREIQVTATPRILSGEFPIEIHAIPVRIHKARQHFLPEINLFACNMDRLIGKMTLQALLKQTSEPFRPWSDALYERVQMGIIDSLHPNAHAGNLGTDGHAVPAKHLVFHCIERYIRSRSV